MGQAGTQISEGKLPPDLAAALSPGLREALENPVRREMLRTLQACDRALSTAEIAGQVTGLTASEAAYHARVLERAGGMTAVGDGSPPAGDRRRYASGVADERPALAALRATQQWDRSQRRARVRRSTMQLTMFRVPRPTRSIRLGNREGGRGREG